MKVWGMNNNCNSRKKSISQEASSWLNILALCGEAEFTTTKNKLSGLGFAES